MNITANDGAPLVVSRPPHDKTRLKRKAAAEGKTPRQLLSEVIGRTSSFDEAARELGCSTRALLAWRKRYGVEVR